MLAPESGDTYCLITVLPHDKAIAYASSRRFSVNQALGVLEVRDEEALQQMQPTLEAAAQAKVHRLFDDVSDADLTRLGVLGSVRGAACKGGPYRDKTARALGELALRIARDRV